MIVLGWNSFQSDRERYALAASASVGYVQANPERATAILASLDQYTPILQESSVNLEGDLSDVSPDGFAAADGLEHPFVTEPTALEQTYVVRGGDTITGIANSFGLHVATIAERNGISPAQIETIKPDTALIIPSADTSESKDWLVQINQQKEAEHQKALADAAAKANKLAKSNTKTTKVTATGEFDHAAGMNFITPIAYRAIARRLQRDHFGIDFDAPVGTPVHAAQDGRVIEVTGGWAGGFGNSILVSHGGGVTTRYAHLSRIGVSVGDQVSQGQEIGNSGNTGFSTGPHLHFETRVNGKAVDPFR